MVVVIELHRVAAAIALRIPREVDLIRFAPEMIDFGLDGLSDPVYRDELGLLRSVVVRRLRLGSRSVLALRRLRLRSRSDLAVGSRLDGYV
jgi:hypothetical protein